ncbi:MAG: hypothetical protein DMF61_22265 [Blastocatellia bacterium AA13]|nr:MAG: hypothetical protein DMF61_22265 [Blastocatellia bacterium AA13]
MDLKSEVAIENKKAGLKIKRLDFKNQRWNLRTTGGVKKSQVGREFTPALLVEHAVSVVFTLPVTVY